MSAQVSKLPPSIVHALQDPLSGGHLRALSEARRRATKIRRAAAVAAFDGWTTGVFGAISLVGGLWSVPALLLGAALIAAAIIGLRARMALLAFHPPAAARLRWNQLFLWSAITVYCIWSIRQALAGPAMPGLTATGSPEADAMMADISQLARNITLLVYSAVIVICGVLQGGAAWYYFSRRRHVEAYLAATPEWILRMQSALGRE